VFFVDGNNCYHALRDAGLENLGRLNYARGSQKLVGPRVWTATRYYVGQVRQTGNVELYAAQRRYFAFLEACDPRVTVHLGRLEPRTVESEAAKDLRRYLENPPRPIEPVVLRDLREIARTHARAEIVVEKAVDVLIAMDLVTMAERGELDTAYLLSADGDLTPAVEAARRAGRKLFVVSPAYGAKLAAVANAYIRLRPDWFADCFGK
jgi:uncharacterized LabA/DUF88 family protein